MRVILLDDKQQGRKSEIPSVRSKRNSQDKWLMVVPISTLKCPQASRLTQYLWFPSTLLTPPLPETCSAHELPFSQLLIPIRTPFWPWPCSLLLPSWPPPCFSSFNLPLLLCLFPPLMASFPLLTMFTLLPSLPALNSSRCHWMYSPPSLQ